MGCIITINIQTEYEYDIVEDTALPEKTEIAEIAETAETAETAGKQVVYEDEDDDYEVVDG